MPAWLAGSRRWVKCVYGRLVAAVDVYGQLGLFEHDGRLICLFFSFRYQLAAWTPDGTRYGPKLLLGEQPTPGAAEKIGALIKAAWDGAKGRAPA
jgi:hypothetical protein